MWASYTSEVPRWVFLENKKNANIRTTDAKKVSNLAYNDKKGKWEACTNFSAK